MADISAPWRLPWTGFTGGAGYRRRWPFAGAGVVSRRKRPRAFGHPARPRPRRRTLGLREMTSGGERRTGPALEAMYQLVRWLIPTLDRFPRRQKFLLGDRIQTTALDGLERLVEATFTRNRGRLLNQVNVDLDKLRLLLRLAKELGHLDARRYEHGARRLEEVGRLVGGWRRAHRDAEG